MKKDIPIIKTRLTDKDIWDFTVLRKKYNKILQLINKHKGEDIIIKCPHRPELLITQTPRDRIYTVAVLYQDENDNDITYYVYNRVLEE